MFLEDVLLCLLLAEAILFVSGDHEHVFKMLFSCVIFSLQPKFLFLLHLHVVEGGRYDPWPAYFLHLYGML